MSEFEFHSHVKALPKLADLPLEQFSLHRDDVPIGKDGNVAGLCIQFAHSLLEELGVIEKGLTQCGDMSALGDAAGRPELGTKVTIGVNLKVARKKFGAQHIHLFIFTFGVSASADEPPKTMYLAEHYCKDIVSPHEHRIALLTDETREKLGSAFRQKVSTPRTLGDAWVTEV